MNIPSSFFRRLHVQSPWAMPILRGVLGSLSAGMIPILFLACESSDPVGGGASPDGGQDSGDASDEPPDLTNSSIRADPPVVSADGATTMKLTVTVKSASGKALHDVLVNLTATGKQNTFSPSNGRTDAQGVFSATMISTFAEKKTVVATFGSFSLPVNVEFQLCHGRSFLGPISRPLNPGPAGITGADLNQDGKLDLVVANDYQQGHLNSVSVLLGNGDGTFGQASDYGVGLLPWAIAVGEFNSDGIPDLAVVNVENNYVTILLGTGNGKFANGKSVTVGSSEPTDSNAVVVADFNHDKIADLAVSNGGTHENSVSILLGDGTGGFSAPTNISVGTTPVGFALGDFTGDGILDLATPNFGDNTVSILAGDDHGGFTVAKSIQIPSSDDFNLGRLAASDFNGDGHPDLVIPLQKDRAVAVLLADGDGGFGEPSHYSLGEDIGATNVVIGDFDGDDKLDLAVANDSGRNVRVLSGDGKGAFSLPTNYDIGGSGDAVAGDFDGDGRLDLAVAQSSGVSVLLRSGCVP